jgi:hypothetical protein
LNRDRRFHLIQADANLQKVPGARKANQAAKADVRRKLKQQEGIPAVLAFF